jgi:hypothetical protein
MFNVSLISLQRLCWNEVLEIPSSAGSPPFCGKTHYLFVPQQNFHPCTATVNPREGEPGDFRVTSHCDPPRLMLYLK